MRFIWFVTIFAGGILLCNQFIYLYHLYKLERNTYTHHQNEFIKGAVHEFNMESVNVKKAGKLISFNAKNKKLTYITDNRTIHYQLQTKDNIKHITEQCFYDIRDIDFWTLEHLYTYMLKKQDSATIHDFSIQFIVLDTTGKIKDAYPKQLFELSPSCQYKDTLGFITKDILMVSYNYPSDLFLFSAAGQIILVIFFTALLILCIVNLYQTLRREKKSGKYRELFIGNMVHDLKRPVVNQLKIGHLFRDSVPPEKITLLKQSEKQLNEMLQTIHRMLLQSTDEHGLRLKLQEFDLREMLQALTENNLWSCTAEKQFDIKVRFLSSEAVITGDYHFLNAVFLNLTDNALKYSGEQVNINITCEDIDARQIRILIEDNGFGISPQNLKHVFERYHRGDQQNNRAIKGHGQGLHYARTVIRAHGGSIDIESTAGKGTRIIVILPRKKDTNTKYHRYLWERSIFFTRKMIRWERN